MYTKWLRRGQLLEVDANVLAEARTFTRVKLCGFAVENWVTKAVTVVQCNGCTNSSTMLRNSMSFCLAREIYSYIPNIPAFEIKRPPLSSYDLTFEQTFASFGGLGQNSSIITLCQLSTKVQNLEIIGRA